MQNTREKITSLGYKLNPVAAPIGSYLHCVRTGNLLHLSGGLSINGEESYFGKVGVDLTLEEGQAAARAAILNRLAVIEAEIGSLDKIVQVVALNGFVNSGADYTDHPKVINGASDLLVEVFGDKGRHSRAALGVSCLPLNAAVEISMIVEVE